MVPRPPVAALHVPRALPEPPREATLNALFDNSPVPMVILSPMSEIVRTTRSFNQQFVLRTDKLLGLPFVECLVSSAREPVEKLLAQLRRGESSCAEIDAHLRASDSHQPSVRLHLSAIHEGDQFVGTTVVVRELLPIVPLSAPTQDETEYYQLMFAINPVPMYIFDLETLGFLDVNEAMVRQYGYSREEFTTLTLKEIRPPEEIPRLLRSLDVFRDHHYPPTAWLHRHKDGNLFHMEVTTHVIRFRGRRCRLAMAQDVTQKVLAVRALEEREQTLRTIGDNLPGGAVYQATISQDGTRRFVHFSAGIERIVGLTPKQIIEDGRRLYELIHPEDFAMMMASEERSIRELIPFDAEFRSYNTRGELVHLHCRSAPRRLNDGTILWDGIVFDVTEEKRNRDALINIERQFSDLLENIQMTAIIFDGEGKLTYCNPFFEKLTGWKREECLGCDYLERFVFEGDRGWMRATLLPSIVRGQFPRHFQNPLRMRSGELRTLSWNNSAVRDSSGNIVAMASIGEDVTERLRSEEILRDREKLLRSLGDNLPGGVIYQYLMPRGTEGRYTYVSQGVSKLSPFRPEEMLSGRVRLRDYMNPEDQEKLSTATMISTETLEPIDYETRMHFPEIGDRIWQWRAVTHRLPDGGAGWDGIILDLTEQRRLASQLQQAQKFQTISVLAGGIAHDFNNLLTGILGFADLATLELPADQPVQEYLLNIVQSAQRAAELCQQMLAYSGQGRYLIGPIHLTQLLREMARLVRTVISKKAELKFELNDQLPTFQGDTTQIRQIILNLLTNASEALPERGGIIHLRSGIMSATREFFISTIMHEELPDGEYVYLEVEDTGCGMSPDTLKQIFDPFFTTKFKGRGLGLAALLGIVRSHRGGVRVLSELGKGTSFRVVFPTFSAN